MQVCKHCGSSEVARTAWVNVNTSAIYHGEESGTDLEWCMTCRDQTNIIEKEDYEEDEEDEDIEDDDERRYWATGGDLGPTGHGDICYSDADPGL